MRHFVVMESEFSEIRGGIGESITDKYCVYKGTVVSDKYYRIADAVENFEVRDDDVWICSFSRSGTTWTQEMVWMIVNDLDFEGARVTIEERMPFLDYCKPAPTVNPSQDHLLQHIEEISKLPSPRYIKTHMPYHLLPRQLRERQNKCKVVYVSRNPKDACISFYHFFKLELDYQRTFEEFCQAFMEDKIMYTPYWNHVNGYFEKRDNENFLFVTFEDMKSDLGSVIRKTAVFFGKQLNDQQIEVLKDHLSFVNMQKNPAVNREKVDDAIYEARGDNTPVREKFIRCGDVGQWKTVMSKDLINRFDKWIGANSKKFLKRSL